MKRKKRIRKAAMKQYEADLAATKKAKEAADYRFKLAAYQTELARVQKATPDAKVSMKRLLKKTQLKTMLSKLKMNIKRNETAKATYEAKIAHMKKTWQQSSECITKTDYQTSGLSD